MRVFLALYMRVSGPLLSVHSVTSVLINHPCPHSDPSVWRITTDSPRSTSRCRLLAHVSSLECAVPRTASVTTLECAVPKMASRKSFRMRSSEKRWGGTATFSLHQRRSSVRRSKRSAALCGGQLPECAATLAACAKGWRCRRAG